MSVDQKYLDMAKDLTRNDFAVSKFSKFGAAPPAEEETASTGGMPIVTGLEAYLGMARELTNIKTQPMATPKRKIPFQEMGEEFAGNRAERLLRQYNSPSPYQHTDSYGQERVRAVAAIETPRVFLQAPFTEAELQGALNAIYKQVFGNTYVMESERPIFAESQLRDGQLTVRGFIRELVKTEVYKIRFFYKSSQNRFIELNFKLLLGRAPYSQQEISEHVLRYNTEGYDAELNSYLDSEEYSENFGEDTVPYYRGFNYQVGQTGPAFSRMIDLYDGYATSDSDRAQVGQVARLTEGLSKPVKQDTPPPEQVDWIAPTFVTSEAYTRYQFTVASRQNGYRTRAASETAKVELQTPCTNEEFQVALRAIYRQVLGNAYVMESERPTVAESKLKEGKLSVRGFIRELAKSETYMNRFLYKNVQTRFIELNYKVLLGRAPYNQQEISKHIALYNAQGYEAEIDSYLDSEEYLTMFGENTVPYYQGFKTQTGQSMEAFDRMAHLYDGYAGSDRSGQVTRLSESLGLAARRNNAPSYIYTPIPYQSALDQSFAPPMSYDRSAYKLTPYQQTMPFEPVARPVETAQVMFQVPCTDEEFQVALRAIYRQIFGNAYVMESERSVIAESKLKEGKLSVRGFIRELVQSETYMNRFLYRNAQTRFVELNYKLLLGRAPYDRQEISEHIALYNAQGYQAEMNSYLDSEEYMSMFGEDTVPFIRGSNPRTIQTVDAFNRNVSVHDDLAGSAARVAERVDRWEQMLAASYIYVPEPYRPSKRLETTKVELRAPFSEEEFQVALRAIYKQIFDGTNLLESERPISIESQLRNGELTIRGFIGRLVKSEVYMNRFFANSAQNRFIEQNFKLLLGRAPHDQAEIAEHVERYSAQGYETEMDSYLNSEEYLSTFGEDTVPYYRDFETQTNQSDYAGRVKH
jgi:5-carboxymethyl-2-hydroxymuconate isomerase